MKELSQMVEEITNLLQAHAFDSEARESIAPLVANNSIKLNHLYEDMGFSSREQMNSFMKKNFPTLAMQKPSDKRWKKFLFDEIGEVAPACAYCGDVTNCHVCNIVN